jgi:hypothetical protein
MNNAGYFSYNTTPMVGPRVRILSETDRDFGESISEESGDPEKPLNVFKRKDFIWLNISL